MRKPHGKPMGSHPGPSKKGMGGNVGNKTDRSSGMAYNLTKGSGAPQPGGHSGRRKAHRHYGHDAHRLCGSY